MNSNEDMLKKAKKIVVNYFNEHSERTDNFKLTEDQVYIVWFSKTLQNWKALVSTTISDGMYYEVTYNGDKKETYLDAYKKWQNVRYPDSDMEESENSSISEEKNTLNFKLIPVKDRGNYKCTSCGKVSAKYFIPTRDLVTGEGFHDLPYCNECALLLHTVATEILRNNKN